MHDPLAHKRKPAAGKFTELPVDYARLVTEVLTANFDAGLKALTQLTGSPTRFEVSGKIHPDEIVAAVTIATEGEIAATTIRASADFDPKASSPNVQDLLGVCVDAIGMLLSQLFDPSDKKAIEKLANRSAAALENVPFEWASVDVDGRKVWLKVDKSNPKLDSMADDWLAKNDPEREEREAREHAETEKLFVTGPSAKKDGRKPGGSVH